MDSTEKTLLQLVADAQDAVSTYVNPDLAEFRARINPILRAGGKGSLGDDKIVSIYYSSGNLHINTTYEVRCCTQRGHFEIPNEVLSADDPVRIYKIYTLSAEVKRLSREVVSAETALGNLRTKLRQKMTELDNMHVGTGSEPGEHQEVLDAIEAHNTGEE